MLKLIVSKSTYYTPLSARDRTEILNLHGTKKEKKQHFRYVDICSLDSYLNSNCPYPVGHTSEILITLVFAEAGGRMTTTTEVELDLNTFNQKINLNFPSSIYCQLKCLLEDWFGLNKSLVLPPQNLMIPVLPFKSNWKFFFHSLKMVRRRICCRQKVQSNL